MTRHNDQVISTLILSIIIPAYNSARFIKRTVESVINSGISSINYEILIINDGSSDGTLMVCSELIKRYPEIIRVLSQDNQGIGKTRNLGIAESKGAFIWFVDSDDYIRPNSISKFIKYVFDPQKDILGFSSDTVDEVNGVLKLPSRDNELVLFEGDGMEYLEKYTPTFVWVYWYKRSFLIENDLCFDATPCGEDLLFNYRAFLNRPSCLISNSKVYCYVNYNSDNHQLTKQRDKSKMGIIVHSYMVFFSLLYEARTKGLSQPAIDRTFCMQVIPFLSRALSSDIKRKVWKEFVISLKDKKFIPIKNKRSFILKIVDFIFSTPRLFTVYCILYCYIILPLFVQRLDRSR